MKTALFTAVPAKVALPVPEAGAARADGAADSPARARAVRAGSWVSEGTLGVQEARASDARAGRKGNSDARASVRGWGYRVRRGKGSRRQERWGEPLGIVAGGP